MWLVAVPVLPPKYYLTHFFEFVDFLESHYRPVMDPSHIKFLIDFRSLPEESQCVYVRMVNRKGLVFDRSHFQKYSELDDTRSALSRLQEQDFVGDIQDCDKNDLVDFLAKPLLHRWLTASAIACPKLASKQQLVELSHQNISLLKLDQLQNYSSLTVQRRSKEMSYLMFLYFGSIQESLSLYTLRDLGIRQSLTLKTQFKPRFVQPVVAKTEYFLAHSLANISERDSLMSVQVLMERLKQPQELSNSAQMLKDQILLKISQLQPSLALEALLASQSPEARETAVRNLYKEDRKNEARSLLEEIIENPRSDVELFFAEDFLARKFEKRKQGYLSHILNNSAQIILSDLYLKRPERGVCDFYESRGYTAQFTENYLWLSLFGILFWEELFENESTAIHNPFERSPSDLVGSDFYKKNVESIENKLLLLQDLKVIQKHILLTVAKNYGRLNDIFQWNEALAKSLLSFVQSSVNQNVGAILRSMAQNFEQNHSGFPDLMVTKDGLIKFIEVKAEGDSLRANQLAKIRLLKESGFEVDVLRVKWQTNPNQIYVVVDVETTGGSADFHRVTEVGAVKIQNGQVIEEFQTLINPGRPIPAFITGITGITNAMVAAAPPFSEIAEKFMHFLEGALFVAHNAKFDYGFIQREFARTGIDFVRPQICTCSGMRKAFPGLKSYGLKNLTEHFEISLEQHHRALADARAAAELLLIMQQKVPASTLDANLV